MIANLCLDSELHFVVAKQHSQHFSRKTKRSISRTDNYMAFTADSYQENVRFMMSATRDAKSKSFRRHILGRKRKLRNRIPAEI